MKVDTYRPVETPEGVELGLRVAGPTVRAVAWLFDAIIRLTFYFVFFTFLSMLGLVMGESATSFIILLTLFVVEWFYGVAFEVFRDGATPGKRACRLHVVHTDGTPVGWNASVIRNFLLTIDFLPALFGFGLVSCLASRDFQRLGDRVAGTYVVHNDRADVHRAPIKAVALAPPVALRAEEQRALLDFAERMPTWTAARSEELAEILEPLTGARGKPGLERVLGMGAWLSTPR